VDNFLTVKAVAKRLNKSEETIKRWLRSGEFANAFKESDKLGWKIPLEDVQGVETSNCISPHLNEEMTEMYSSQALHNENSKELVSLAYQAVTMTSPTDTIINLLNYIGIKRTLEILLIMSQSPKKVKNPEGFIRKAISKGWTPTTLPIKKERNVARVQSEKSEYRRQVPFYNWLEED
jgi:IS30 family transposase